jgi:acyl carrier protein
MNQEQILIKMQTVLKKEISYETVFAHAFEDSLDALDNIAEIEDAFDIVIPISILTGINTIGDLIEHIEIAIMSK